MLLAPVGGVLLEDVNKEGIGDGSHHVVSQEGESGQLLVQPVTHLFVLLQAGDDVLLAKDGGQEGGVDTGQGSIGEVLHHGHRLCISHGQTGVDTLRTHCRFIISETKQR